MAILDGITDIFFGPRQKPVDPEYEKILKIVGMAKAFLDEVEKAGPISDEQLKLLADAKAKEYREMEIFTERDDEILFTGSVRKERRDRLERLPSEVSEAA